MIDEHAKQRARRMVRDALKRGELVRASVCNRCGDFPARGKDGRATIHAHHADYSAPLAVEWICAACHRKETPLPTRMGAPVYGVSNGMARLTPELVALIVRSPLSGIKLAPQIGVHRTTIDRVRRGETWIAAALPAAPQEDRE